MAEKGEEMKKYTLKLRLINQSVTMEAPTRLHNGVYYLKSSEI